MTTSLFEPLPDGRVTEDELRWLGMRAEDGFVAAGAATAT